MSGLRATASFIRVHSYLHAVVEHVCCKHDREGVSAPLRASIKVQKKETPEELHASLILAVKSNACNRFAVVFQHASYVPPGAVDLGGGAHVARLAAIRRLVVRANLYLQNRE